MLCTQAEIESNSLVPVHLVATIDYVADVLNQSLMVVDTNPEWGIAVPFWCPGCTWSKPSPIRPPPVISRFCRYCHCPLQWWTLFGKESRLKFPWFRLQSPFCHSREGASCHRRFYVVGIYCTSSTCKSGSCSYQIYPTCCHETSAVHNRGEYHYHGPR